MKPTILFCAALAAAPFLCAQGDKQQMPNPKTKQHEALATLAGTWQSTCKMAAIPGVPGMEKAKEWTGTDQCELICDGLWLKTTMDSTCDGEFFQGVWLAGYDPIEKSYKSIWVSSHDEPSSIASGSYDEKTKTWTFSGSSPMGEFRSVTTLKDADHATEVCYMKGPDGKEVECMNIVRKRTSATAKDATAKVSNLPSKTPASLAKEHSLVAESVGHWEAVVTTTIPGQPPMEEKASEHVIPICDGKWYWSDFKGSMNGQPFTGHSLIGWDATAKQYVGYWIDSGSAQFAKVAGSHDAAKNAFTFEGDCIGMDGKPQKIHEIYSQKDHDNRTLEMTFKGADATHQMKIVYRRVKG